MTESTARKVDLVLRELRARQQRGEMLEGCDGIPVSTETMARVSREIGQPLHEKTFRRIERTALAKARLALAALPQFPIHNPR